MNFDFQLHNEVEALHAKYLNFKKPEHKYPKYFKNCLVCSEEFKLKLYRFNSAKFCSFKCYWKSLTGKECLK